MARGLYVVQDDGTVVVDVKKNLNQSGSASGSQTPGGSGNTETPGGSDSAGGSQYE